MELSEQDLLTFQICPRRYQFSKAKQEVQQKQLVSLQQFIAVWMWTYEVIHGQKCSLKHLKEKWAHTVTKSHIQAASNKHSILSPVGDMIASGFPLVMELYELYQFADFQPAATMLPIRLVVPHAGVVKCTAHVVGVNDLGNTVIMNFIDDSTIRDTVTNLVNVSRLIAAHDDLAATQSVNYRLIPDLPVTYLRIADLDQKQVKRNVKHILLAMKDKVDYPILNCRLNCPYKSQCN